MLPPELRVYAELGGGLFPVKPRDKTPLVQWKIAATLDATQLEEWARRFPECNWGWAVPEGFVVVDVDGSEGLEQAKALEAKGCELPPTLTIQTGRGLHCIYRTTARFPKANPNLAGKINTRTQGGFVVAAGSTHGNGVRYEILDKSPVADAPEWLIDRLTAPQTQPTPARGKIGEGGRNSHLTSVAGSLRKHGADYPELKAALLVENGKRCDPPLPEKEVDTIARSIEKYLPPANVTALLNDPRPKIMLPFHDRLLSDFAADLGSALRGALFRHGQDIVRPEGGELRVISAQALRTEVERYIICCKQRNVQGFPMQVGVTMQESEARGVLQSPHLLERLQQIKRVATCRLPVMRDGGRIEMLPEGYDEASECFTASDVEYREDMALAEALAVIEDLYSEFIFVDPARSKAVAISALVGLYAARLLPTGALRPTFIYTKNAEGAGATTCAACAIVPVTGTLPTGTAPSDGEEMRKLLTTSLREGHNSILLDNVKHTVGGAALESFVTAPVWRDRLLGVNQTGEYENNATISATMNGASLTPDMRRRSLICELHLAEERAEDRVFARPLDLPALLALRPRILAACWSLVRHWDSKGRPEPSRSHSAFPEWARIVGGIVEAAGYACPLDTPASAVAVDEDGAAMRVLTAAMRVGKKYPAPEVYELCRTNQVFLHLVGSHAGAMDNSRLSTIGRLFARYHDRLVGERRFKIEGVGHSKRFFVEVDLHGCTVVHGVSPRASEKGTKSPIGRNTVQTVQTVQSDHPHQMRKFTLAGRYGAAAARRMR